MKFSALITLLLCSSAAAQVTFPGKSDRMFLASEKVFFSACGDERPDIPLATRDDVLGALAATGMSLDSLQSLDSAGFHWLRGDDTAALELFEEITGAVPFSDTEFSRALGWTLDEGSFLAWQWDQWDSSAMRFWPTQTLPICSLHALDVSMPAATVPEPASAKLLACGVLVGGVWLRRKFQPAF